MIQSIKAQTPSFSAQTKIKNTQSQLTFESSIPKDRVKFTGLSDKTISNNMMGFNGSKKERHPIRNLLLGLGALCTVATGSGCKMDDANTPKAPPPTVAMQTVNGLQRLDKTFLTEKGNTKAPLKARELADFVYKIAEANSELAQKHDMQLVGVVTSSYNTKTIPSEYSKNVINLFAEKSDAKAENMIAVPARITNVSKDENGDTILTVLNFVYEKENAKLSDDIARINESLKEVDPSNPSCNERRSFAMGVGTGMLLSN